MNGKVYDVAKYLQSHPGGVGNIMAYAGKDATKAFKDQRHSVTAIEIA